MMHCRAETKMWWPVSELVMRATIVLLGVVLGSAIAGTAPTKQPDKDVLVLGLYGVWY